MKNSKNKRPIIAIHRRVNSFSERWIEVCQEVGYNYRVVDCFSNTIFQDLNEIDILLWHWHHNDPPSKLCARDLLRSADIKGLTVFPDSSTCWSFDNKLAQKYQLQSIGAPLAETAAFFQRKDALEWADSVSFPKVFKLRCGAGSSNVRLLKTKKEAIKIINQAFGNGFSFKPPHIEEVKDYLGKQNPAGSEKIKKLFNLPGRLNRYFQRSSRAKDLCRLMGNEIGYVLFQSFIPNNQYDIRITVVGDKAFGFTRNVRKNDWRASGSGSIDYNITRVDPLCVKIAFDITQKLGCQSIAFDFVMTENCEPLIVETSYCYNSKAIYNCPGYWDVNLNYHIKHLWPQDLILELVIKQWKDKIPKR